MHCSECGAGFQADHVAASTLPAALDEAITSAVDLVELLERVADVAEGAAHLNVAEALHEAKRCVRDLQSAIDQRRAAA